MAKAFTKQMAAQIPENGVLEVVLEDEESEPVCSKTVGLTTCKSAVMNPDYFFIFIGPKEGETVFSSVPVLASYVRDERYPTKSINFNNHFVSVMPTLNSTQPDQGYGMSVTFRRSKDLTAKFRIDLGEVAEDDLEAVSGFQVKIEYAKPQAEAN